MTSAEYMQEITYVVTDFSPSMDIDDYEPTRLEGAILAAKKFIATKAEHYPQDLVGLIGFDNKAHLLHRHIPVGLNVENLYQALHRLSKFNDPATNFTVALSLAEKHLLGKECHRPRTSISGFFRDLLFESTQETGRIDKDIAKRLILLTDGQNTSARSPIKPAQRLKEGGVVIECIGIAGSPRRVDEKLLRKIASKDEYGTPLYSFIGDTSQLVKKYESMAHHIQAV